MERHFDGLCPEPQLIFSLAGSRPRSAEHEHTPVLAGDAEALITGVHLGRRTERQFAKRGVQLVGLMPLDALVVEHHPSRSPSKKAELGRVGRLFLEKASANWLLARLDLHEAWMAET